MRTCDGSIGSSIPYVNRSDWLISGMNRAGVLSRAAKWVMLTELPCLFHTESMSSLLHFVPSRRSALCIARMEHLTVDEYCVFFFSDLSRECPYCGAVVLSTALIRNRCSSSCKIIHYLVTMPFPLYQSSYILANSSMSSRNEFLLSSYRMPAAYTSALHLL
jgi:hypothetical protein